MSRTARTSRDLEVLLTVGEVASQLRCSPDTVRRRVADGSLASLRLAGVIRIPVAELERVLAQATRPRIIE